MCTFYLSCVRVKVNAPFIDSLLTGVGKKPFLILVFDGSEEIRSRVFLFIKDLNTDFPELMVFGCPVIAVVLSPKDLRS